MSLPFDNIPPKKVARCRFCSAALVPGNPTHKTLRCPMCARRKVPMRDKAPAIDRLLSFLAIRSGDGHPNHYRHSQWIAPDWPSPVDQKEPNGEHFIDLVRQALNEWEVSR